MKRKCGGSSCWLNCPVSVAVIQLRPPQWVVLGVLLNVVDVQYIKLHVINLCYFFDKAILNISDLPYMSR